MNSKKEVQHVYLVGAKSLGAYGGYETFVYKLTEYHQNIPCARELTKGEVESDYEANTGKVIVETIENRRLDPIAVPGIVVKNHGPFAWGKSPENAVYNAVVMEKVAEMDLKTLMLNPNAEMKQYVLDKHYMRKHGPNAYYGQK